VTLAVKRSFDVTVALVLVVATAPIVALTAVLVRVTMGSPVFFVQERLGRHRTPFRLTKVRTMSEAPGVQDFERLTPIGRLLRRTSLDELPQLWNVVKGDMSLVGPRPLLPRYGPYFRAEEEPRFSVRPGITGLAQISGRNSLTWDQRLQLDVQYVRGWSWGLEARILGRTVGQVLTGRGHVSAPDIAMQDLDEERADGGYECAVADTAG
jgi:sugar transferase EpsL